MAGRTSVRHMSTLDLSFAYLHYDYLSTSVWSSKILVSGSTPRRCYWLQGCRRAMRHYHMATNFVSECAHTYGAPDHAAQADFHAGRPLDVCRHVVMASVDNILISLTYGDNGTFSKRAVCFVPALIIGCEEKKISGTSTYVLGPGGKEIINQTGHV
ncbi:hypothetical protein T310_7369 [Rasamsonia emersonii CBS 393.64]|uniref:Uncharacterized protein n=1 Tax=Rasamsonia emersonii (strain ATCC 16479 / CBS 393.64 / IMI 116815) TaxID=1408163 RepID=A0A0F4YK79_RASE3|nr:hypothetical protein T310_7369 [Rasamsonia emersonii CBS 393.64]KKA18672.1 hypothetical protein T310_7369 [Rasamsonia emersonii CBS 393.64]